MSKVVLEVPTLWADHHVLKVRDALVNLEGVNDVYVSSAWKQVLVAYDDGKTDQLAIEKALADAGGRRRSPHFSPACGQVEKPTLGGHGCALDRDQPS